VRLPLEQKLNKMRKLLLTLILGCIGIVAHAQTFCNVGISAIPDSTNPCEYTFFTTNNNSLSTSGYLTFGDGSMGTPSISGATHQYTTSGWYTVCYYYYDSINNCSDTACTSVFVSSACGGSGSCNANMTYTTNGCNAYFINTSSINYTSAVWYFGDGNSVSNTNSTVVHTYAGNGLYYPFVVVTWSVNGATCTDTSTLGQVYISGCSSSSACNAMLSAMQDSTNPCQFNFVTFNNNSLSGLGTIAFGDGTFGAASASGTSHQFATPGWYTACYYLYDSINNCSDTSCYTFYVSTGCGSGGGCNASFTFGVNGCTGIFLNNSLSGYTSAVWYFGDGNSVSNANQTVLHTYANSGTYYPFVIVTWNSGGTTCVDTSSLGQITVTGCGGSGCNANITAIPDSLNPCEYDFFTINNNTMTGSGYVTFGDGSSAFASVNGVNHQYANAGTYNVCFYYDDSLTGCLDTACVTIIVSSGCGGSGGCNASMTYTTSGCNAYFVNTSNVNYTSAVWYFGDGNSVSNTSSTVTHTYAGNGLYYPFVVVTWSINGATCTDTSSLGQVSITGCGGTGCNASFVYWQDSSSPCTFYFLGSGLNSFTTAGVFSFGNNTSAAASPNGNSVTYTSNGTYLVCYVLVDSVNNCVDTACQYVTVTGCSGGGTSCVAFVAAALDSLNPCEVKVSYVGTSNFFSTGTLWYGDGSSAAVNTSGGTNVHQYTTNGTYTITFVLVDTVTGCVDSATQVITITGCQTNSIAKDQNFADTYLLYPNPANTTVQLAAKSGNSISYTLIDVTGKQISAQRKVQPQHTINVEQLAPGTYYVIVQQDTNRSTMVFTKQ
jgi:hypothetical protein